MILLALILNYLMPTVQATQAPVESTHKFLIHFNKGDSLLRMGQLELALREYELSKELNHKDSAGFYVKVQSRIGQIYGRLSRFQECLQTSEETLDFIIDNDLEDAEISIRVYQNLGILNQLMGNYETSLKYASRCLNLNIKYHGEDDGMTANTYNNMSNTYFQLGNLNKTILYLEKSLAINERIGQGNHPNTADSYHNLCDFYMQKGWYDKSIYYIHKSLKIREETHSEHDPKLAMGYSSAAAAYAGRNEYILAEKMFDIAWSRIQAGEYSKSLEATEIGAKYGEFLLKIGDYTKAKSILDISLNISTEHFDKKTLVTGNIAILLARLHRRKENYPLASEYLESALNVATELNNAHLKINALYEYGELASSQKDYTTAEEYYIRSSNQYQLINQTGLSRAYYKLAVINDTDSAALSYCEQAIDANSRESNVKDLSLNNLIILDIPLHLNILDLKSQLLVKSNSEECLETLETADSIIRDLRNHQFSLKDKLRLSESSHEIYNRAIRISSEEYVKNESDENFIKAYDFLAKSKGEILKSAASEVNARKFIGVSDSILIFEKELISELNYLKSRQLEVEFSKSNITNTIDSLEIKLLDHKNTLEANHPKYYDHKYQNNSITLDSYKASIPAGQSTIAYHLGDQHIYIFHISKNNQHLKVVERPEKFELLIQQLWVSLNESNAHQFNELSALLYNILLSPIDELFLNDNLTIIPNDILWNIPFDLLVRDKKSGESFKDFDYLLKNHSVTYNYSFNESYGITTQPSEQLMGFAYSDAPQISSQIDPGNLLFRNNILTELPGTGLELNIISEVMPGQYFYGRSSKEALFKETGPDYKIIHLALHGIVDDENPENSRLIFQAQPDSIDDNTLFTHELYNMNLNSNLVVLSACQSGGGKIVTGEGIMSLGHAFAYAGAQNILMSQWDVADAISPQIMKSFYTYLGEGISIDVALQKAKLDFLAQSDNATANPLYWGSYYNLGQSTVIISYDLNWTFKYFILAAMIIIITVYLKKRNKK